MCGGYGEEFEGYSAVREYTKPCEVDVIAVMSIFAIEAFVLIDLSILLALITTASFNVVTLHQAPAPKLGSCFAPRTYI